uniref:Intraflagellar transport protein 46 homolog n=1 Tax=Megaselia scalaris TaxID=36166 RepID=T1GHN5_MEGSC
MGLSYLDEPSGHQSDPSVLSIKMRSVLTGSGKHSANIKIPIAKNAKDIDKWINEVEQFHVGQTIVDLQNTKDVQTLLAEWPMSFERVIEQLESGEVERDQEESLTEYVKSVCQMFGIEIVEETQL